MDFSKLSAGIKTSRAALQKREKTIKPKPGDNRYVLLQGWRTGEEHVFHHKFGQHYVKNAAGEIQAVYPCATMTFDEPCAVCDGLAKAVRSATSDETIALLKEANATQRYLFNVLELDGTTPNTPQTIEFTKTTAAAVLGIVEEWATAIFDPANPQILVINKTGKGLDTRYTAQVSPKKFALPPGVLAAIPDLDKFVAQESEDQMKRALTAINANVGILPSRDTPATTTVALPRPVSRDVSDAVIRTPKAPAIDDDLDALLDAEDLDEVAL